MSSPSENKKESHERPKTMGTNRFRQISLETLDKTIARGLGQHVSDRYERSSLHNDLFNPHQEITPNLLKDKIEHTKKMEEAARFKYKTKGYKEDLEEIDRQKDRREILTKALKELEGK